MDTFDHNIKLIDINCFEHFYEVAVVLIISRYSDTIFIIKKESNEYIQYVGEKIFGTYSSFIFQND